MGAAETRPIARGVGAATTKAQYDLKSKAEIFYILRREILAARLKISLDKKFGRPTSEKVRRFAAMDLPPVIR
ncbi:hypothetical protein [Nesterenkonia sp. DZ6]|uniref:hypothetical protein n=1 Tax=Nesterenkonia sp. DZ6 TaxID=2901229 RepID=UPI001F4D217B|nr:hypothetical protein [Nesterenkonia sp. DZ6]MCH8560344.1 hypothetical protein [Nesterenkonia sp. DZ6]